ncbi:MAG: response regulator [Fibrobacter sp.]|nr:response regulator [Synergistaceae bacterium]NLG39883.1 response regulator [Fibrobacter sp.]
MENSDKLRVVIADDEPIIRIHLTELLKSNGYNVVAGVGDGFAAMEACNAFKPNIVLLDVKMPVLDGLAAAHYIFENFLAETIVMISAYNDVDLVNRAMVTGVAGYLVKPINEKELIPCIKIARARSKEINELRKEVESAKKTIEERKIIEKAKGLIVEREKISEQKAYDYIREISKMQKLSMYEVAKMILKSIDFR